MVRAKACVEVDALAQSRSNRMQHHASTHVVQVLLAKLELQKSTVNLVDDKDRPDTLGKSLTEHSLSLHTYTVNGVDDDKGTVSDTKGSSDFRREVDVTGGVDEVDQETVT